MGSELLGRTWSYLRETRILLPCRRHVDQWIAHVFDRVAGMRGSDLAVRVIHAYRFALDPTPIQDTALRSHCGGQRFAFNWGLGQVRANLAQRDAERSYGVPDQQLTPS